MFTHKTFIALTLLVGIGSVGSLAQIQRNKIRVAPMSSYDRKIRKCELHGSALQVANVPIHYGIVGFPAGYYDASRRSFPHADSKVMGGCVVSKDSPDLQAVKYCPQCRAAEKRWSNAHKPTNPTR